MVFSPRLCCNSHIFDLVKNHFIFNLVISGLFTIPWNSPCRVANSFLNLSLSNVINSRQLILWTSCLKSLYPTWNIFLPFRLLQVAALPNVSWLHNTSAILPASYNIVFTTCHPVSKPMPHISGFCYASISFQVQISASVSYCCIRTTISYICDLERAWHKVELLTH